MPGVPARSAAEDGRRQVAVEEEQKFLDQALARHAQILEQVREEVGTAPVDAAGQARVRALRQRLRELDQARDGLVFGRLDALDGTVRHIGRIGVRAVDDAADPLVVDWRADAARPFYTATPVNPLGQARRRHLHVSGPMVTGVDDEPLDGTGGDDLVGEGALLNALGQRRTGRMKTAIATLQREQDEIIRAPAGGPLIVQGGPGTGKTVVALHRVAYLLFSHRQMTEQAVLVLGPSPRFLEYIAQVLPALGETAVVSATGETLLPGVAVTRPESRLLSEIKGRALWQGAVETYAAALVPTARELIIRWEGEEFTVSAAKVGQSLTAVAGRSYHDARKVFTEQLRQILADAVVERREAMLVEVEEGFEDILARFGPAPDGPGENDGQMSEDEVEDLRERIVSGPEVPDFVAGWWPDLGADQVLERFLHSEELLRKYAAPLSADEIALVAGEPVGWSASDIPLLDALADRLGEARTVEFSGDFVADRARQQRDWVYGHVVIDEAQELSDMQWQMVLRRCPTRSITAVGDIDQTEASHRHTSWADAVRSSLGERWTAAELTICYRTPREVMDLTGPVLEKAGSRNRPPRAVRSSGVPAWERSVPARELVPAAVEAVTQLRERWAGGTVGVVAPVARVAALALAIEGVPVLTATEAKGLEWDATLVVDPAGISTEPRGWNGLYVALTRCTQELGRLLPA